LNPEACKTITNADQAKKAAQAILAKTKLDTELYRVGITKVLFKAGVLGTLEEHRDTAISGYLIALQSNIRCYLMKKNIQKMIEAKKAIGTIQRNSKSYLILRNWGWWKLFASVKPLLLGAKREVRN